MRACSRFVLVVAAAGCATPAPPQPLASQGIPQPTPPASGAPVPAPSDAAMTADAAPPPPIGPITPSVSSNRPTPATPGPGEVPLGEAATDLSDLEGWLAARHVPATVARRLHPRRKEAVLRSRVGPLALVLAGCAVGSSPNVVAAPLAPPTPAPSASTSVTPSAPPTSLVASSDATDASPADAASADGGPPSDLFGIEDCDAYARQFFRCFPDLEMRKGFLNGVRMRTDLEAARRDPARRSRLAAACRRAIDDLRKACP